MHLKKKEAKRTPNAGTLGRIIAFSSRFKNPEEAQKLNIKKNVVTCLNFHELFLFGDLFQLHFKKLT